MLHDLKSFSDGYLQATGWLCLHEPIHSDYKTYPEGFELLHAEKRLALHIVIQTIG